MILDAEEDLDVVGEASDGNEAVAQARRLAPDVVLMDIRMPELDGIEATRKVVAAGGDSPPRVLMLTTFDLNEYVYEALRAGASGFLLKDVPPEELAAGIREVEVFKLVARGLSNAEIARELIVSETTVKTHVARLLMKLGLRDRVQAVVLAHEAGDPVPG